MESELETQSNSPALQAKRSTILSGDRSDPHNGSEHHQGKRPNPPVSDHESTPRDLSASITSCPTCQKNFGRIFRRKKTCLRCGKVTCRKCFNICCNHIGSDGAKENLMVQLSVRDLLAYEESPKFYECKLPATTSIFRCRDRELAANLSIGEDNVITFRSQLTPSMSCTCSGAARRKFLQNAEFRFDVVRNQNFSK